MRCYVKKPSWYGRLVRKVRLRQTIGLVNKYISDPDVVEIGPGNCMIAKQKPWEQYRAITPCPSEAEIVKSLGYMCYRSHLCDIDSVNCNTIIAEHVVEHIGPPLISWCAKSLGCNGLLLLKFPDIRFCGAAGFYYKDPTHFWPTTALRVTEVLEQNGFDIIESYPTFLWFRGLASILVTLPSRTLPDLGFSDKSYYTKLKYLAPDTLIVARKK